MQNQEEKRKFCDSFLSDEEFFSFWVYGDCRFCCRLVIMVKREERCRSREGGGEVLLRL